MAASTDSADPSPSSGGSDLEEGELVAGYDDPAGSDLEEGEFVAGADDDIRHEGDGLPEIKRRRLEFEGVVVDVGAPPSPTPSCDRDSDETISDVDAGAASLAQELLFPCLVCGREFTSQKAVSVHMGAHGPHGRENKEWPPVTPAISGGWAVTGKRAFVGGRSVSSESEGVVDFMATVEPNPPNDDSMAILVASSEDPTHQVVVHPPCSPQFLQGHQPAAPQVLVAHGQELAEEAARQFFVHQAAAPQVIAHHVQCTSPPPRDEQGSMATVVSEPVLDPMPIAFASRSSSAEPNPTNDDSMVILVASSEETTNQVVVHPPCSSQFLQGHQPSAPQVLVAQCQQLAEEAARQFFVHQAAAPQVVAHHVQRTSPPPPARDEQGSWLCKEEECDQQYATPQGLGGHMVGHKISGRQLGGPMPPIAFANRSTNAEPNPPNDDSMAKLAKLDPSKQCASMFTSGAQIGGHIRRPMDQFKDALHLRLRCQVHGTYLHADDDGRGVSLRRCRASVNAAWAVHCHGDPRHLRLYSVAYGRYLAATDASAPLGCRGFRVELSTYHNLHEEALLWQALGTESGDDVVLLRNVDERYGSLCPSGRYLRANGRYIRWNVNGVSLDDVSNVSTMMQWVVEPIPSTEHMLRYSYIHANGKHVPWNDKTVVDDMMQWVPQRIRPRPPVLHYLSALLSRTIIFLGNDQWASFSFTFRGRSIYRLRKELVSRLGISSDNSIYLVIYVRGGRYGRFTPLVVDLPRGGQPLVVTAEMQVNGWLLYPTSEIMGEDGKTD